MFKDSEGKSPLHLAIENQHKDIISLLLCHPSIDLTIRDKKGLTPFAAALTFRNNKAAQAILDKLPSAAEQVNIFKLLNFVNFNNNNNIYYFVRFFFFSFSLTIRAKIFST